MDLGDSGAVRYPWVTRGELVTSSERANQRHHSQRHEHAACGQKRAAATWARGDIVEAVLRIGTRSVPGGRR